jgi:hypothetical protein
MARIAVGCSPQHHGPCSGVVGLRAARSRGASTARGFRLAAGRTGTVAVRLSAGTRKALRRKHRVTVTAVVRDQDRRAGAVTRRLSLRLR